MSAFIVSAETMHRVVAAVLAWPNSELARSYSNSTPSDIGNALFNMNWDAVRYRYDDADQFFGPVENYRYQERESTTAERFMAIACLSYQCSEGSVPETPLFKALIGLEDALAFELVNTQLPDPVQRFYAVEKCARENGVDSSEVKSRWIAMRLPAVVKAPWDFS